MAQRMVRNDFVAGEIDPALFGRHDVEMFFHGAASMVNFVPRKTGGVRKRAGTEYLWRISRPEDAEYRAFPFKFDRDEFGIMAFWRPRGTPDVYATFFASYKDGSHATWGSHILSVFSLGTAETLDGMRCTQVGDTMFFTYPGHRMFRATVVFRSASVSWRQIAESAKPSRPQDFTEASAAGFHEAGDGYVATKRRYRLYGVKGGVWSGPRQKNVSIVVPWVASATIKLKFQPDWSSYDYYVLCKEYAGSYGEVSRFYPGTDSPDDLTIGSMSGAASATIDGRVFSGLSSNPSAAWARSGSDTPSPNAKNQDGTHSAATFATGFSIDRTDADDVPVIALDLWVGARALNPSSSVAKVGRNAQTTIRLSDTNGVEIASWSFSALPYSDRPISLAVESPKIPVYGSYRVDFLDASGSSVRVPVRGVDIYSDGDERSWVDTNIEPSAAAGIPDPVAVGDAGFDADIVSVWQQRLVAASSYQHPFTMWFSRVGDIYNFTTERPQNADDAFEASIASTDANKILHIVSQKWLLVFAESGEHVVDSSGGAFSFNTVSVKKTSSVGAHPMIEPTTTEGDVLFVASDARSVYKMDYSLERDSVVPSSVSTRAQHITELHRIKKIAYQRYPDSVLWCLLDDGSLASMTFVPEENVCGWARHRLAGGAGLVVEDIFATGSISAGADTDTTSDIVLVLRDPSRSGDVWFERLRPCVVADAPSKSSAYCRDHMGYAAADYPSGGDPSGAVEASITTMRLEPQQADMIGKQTNVFDATLRLRRSGKVSVRAEGSEKWQDSRTLPDVQGDAVALVRKDEKVAPYALQNRDARLEIKSADEWPCEVLSLCAMVEFGNQKWGG